MDDVAHRTIESNGLSMHVAEAGEGPLVVLLHGFPESWYTWRHQIAALAAAGYHVVAPDQRGYGRTGGPVDPAAYTMLHLVGDVVGLLGALGEGPAVVVGHDWGAPVAWNTALRRPDLVRGVVGVSVPYVPHTGVDTVTALEAALGPDNYQSYFQRVGPPEAELEADVAATLRRWWYGLSGERPDPTDLVLPPGGGVLDVLPDPGELPSWLTDDDLAVMVGELGHSGFGRPLNWYRAAKANNALMAAWSMAPVTVPAAFITGELDVVRRWPGMADLEALLPLLVPDLRSTVVIPGCGHWTGEERPGAVNAALLDFLDGLDG